MRVLAVCPHPDDEAIGCGGTLRRHVVAGDVVDAVFLTSGEQGGHDLPPEEAGPLRESEARRAAAILGLSGIEFWRYPDAHLRSSLPLVEQLVLRLEALAPDVVYVTHSREMHADHRAAARAVGYAARKMTSSKRPDVLMSEVWTPIQQLDEIVDISPFIEVKIAAIRAYQGQVAVMRFDEAARGLARYRGEMHLWPGGDFAEVFTRQS